MVPETGSNTRGPRVLYWGVHNLGYPRNHRIRSYLADQLQAEIDVVDKPTGGRLRRVFGQARRALRGPHDYDFVVLSEFSIQYAFAAWIAARLSRAPLLVDFFVGLHETEVGDLKTTSRRSPRGSVLRIADWLAVRSGTICLTDTPTRATHFQRIYGKRFMALPVGAPDWARGVPTQPAEIDLLYYGSYLPLHGVDLLLRAIAAYREIHPPAQLNRALFVGAGPTRLAAERLVVSLGLSEFITFVDQLQPDSLASAIAQSRMTSGILGSSDKAAGVIANKVWQSLSIGTPVLTRSSPALEEIESIVGELLVLVDELDVNSVVRGIERGMHSAARGRGIDQRLETYVNREFEQLSTFICSFDSENTQEMSR